MGQDGLADGKGLLFNVVGEAQNSLPRRYFLAASGLILWSWPGTVNQTGMLFRAGLGAYAELGAGPALKARNEAESEC